MITTLFFRTWHIIRHEKLLWGLYFIFFTLSEQWTLAAQALGQAQSLWQWAAFLILFRWLFAVATQTVTVVLVKRTASETPESHPWWRAILTSWVQTLPFVALSAALMWPLRNVAFSTSTPTGKQATLLIALTLTSLLAEWVPIVTTVDQSGMGKTYKRLFGWIFKRAFVILRMLVMIIVVGFFTIALAAIAGTIPVLGRAFFVPAIMAAGYGCTYVLATETYRLTRTGGSLVDIQV
ncbi:MAG: hypothetical protein AAB066_00720 [Candidatus Margulisiibacteriota bacterium]